MTNRPLESWERDFFERFGANTIWTVPSRENVETILNIHSFIHQQLTLARADEREEIVGRVEKLQKNCGHDSRSHCLENDCYVHEPNGYHEAIFDAIKIIKGE